MQASAIEEEEIRLLEEEQLRHQEVRRRILPVAGFTVPNCVAVAYVSEKGGDDAQYSLGNYCTHLTKPRPAYIRPPA